MTGEQDSRAASAPRSARFFRAQDAWVLFIAALIASMPERNYDALILFLAIGAFEIAEPRIALFASKRGQIVSIAVKLILSYLLIGWSHTIFSPFYPIFLIPIVSAATTFNLLGFALVTTIACLVYPSFLLLIDWSKFQLPPDFISTLCTRITFYPIIGYIVYSQASAKRAEMRHTQEAANRLAESNRHLREAQASLRRSERLAALGQLTAGLAHELRNPLGTIKASAEMLAKPSMQSRPDVLSEMSGYIVDEVDRTNNLVSRFLDFARPLQIRPSMADIRTAIGDVIRQHTELAKAHDVVMSSHVADTIAPFSFDLDLLKVALSNLLRNAIQASRPGGTVEMRAEDSGEDVVVFVIDRGEGIPAQKIESIFNPFFTTKPEGVGLGLAIVAKIVDEHGGRMNVFSEPDKGTTFEVILPKTEAT